MFADLYKRKKVLVTGHTGFKGSWLVRWLQMLDAELCGIALEPDGPDAHFRLIRPDMRSEYADIRDGEAVRNLFQDFQPEIVFHLAAQPLVRRSYREPVLTFETNLTGTVHVLEAVRKTPSVRAAVFITTDKCYENRENGHACAEEDPLGGYDPYSASKACAELAVSAYRRSFFSMPDSPLIASARAGNVIGGGDWAEDRLIPDLMKAAAAGSPVPIRNPQAVRPWQHVLEPLAGYLALGAKLLNGGGSFASAWNFGPMETEVFSVARIIRTAQQEWDAVLCETDRTENQPHEAGRLLLDCSKAEKLLHWHPVWDTETAVRRTVRWYREFYERRNIITSADLGSYCAAAQKAKLEWTL